MNQKHLSMTNTLLIICGVVLLLAAVWTLLSWLAVRTIEQPKYTVLEKLPTYEIREYAPYIVAEVEVSGSRKESLNEGFRILAGYIFGGNRSRDPLLMTPPVEEFFSVEIPMTAPVVEQVTGATRKVTFSMPSQYTLATLPIPKDPRVYFYEIPARKMAVKRFSWWASESRFARIQESLLSDLKKDGREVIGTPYFAGYTPPFSAPWMHRNEAMVVVK